MEVLRKGSRGDDVKRLQEILGVTADSVFGEKTLETVKAFQREHNLFPDGIVGPKTWDCLLEESELNIVKSVINTHITYDTLRKVKYIAIHYTAGSTSKAGSAENTRKVFLSRPASADFVVDDTTVIQINPDIKKYYCWAVGDKFNGYTGGGRLSGLASNKNTISIEICSNLKKGASALYPNHDGWYFSEEALNKAVELVKYLMKRYDIPKENVVRHYDITGKLCPGIIGWNDGILYDNNGKSVGKRNNSKEWEAFLAKI